MGVRHQLASAGDASVRRPAHRARARHVGAAECGVTKRVVLSPLRRLKVVTRGIADASAAQRTPGDWYDGSSSGTSVPASPQPSPGWGLFCSPRLTTPPSHPGGVLVVPGGRPVSTQTILLVSSSSRSSCSSSCSASWSSWRCATPGPRTSPPCSRSPPTSFARMVGPRPPHQRPPSTDARHDIDVGDRTLSRPRPPRRSHEPPRRLTPRPHRTAGGRRARPRPAGRGPRRRLSERESRRRSPAISGCWTTNRMTLRRDRPGTTELPENAPGGSRARPSPGCATPPARRCCATTSTRTSPSCPTTSGPASSAKPHRRRWRTANDTAGSGLPPPARRAAAVRVPCLRNGRAAPRHTAPQRAAKPPTAGGRPPRTTGEGPDRAAPQPGRDRAWHADRDDLAEPVRDTAGYHVPGVAGSASAARPRSRRRRPRPGKGTQLHRPTVGGRRVRSRDTALARVTAVVDTSRAPSGRCRRRRGRPAPCTCAPTRRARPRCPSP